MKCIGCDGLTSNGHGLKRIGQNLTRFKICLSSKQRLGSEDDVTRSDGLTSKQRSEDNKTRAGNLTNQRGKPQSEELR